MDHSADGRPRYRDYELLPIGGKWRRGRGGEVNRDRNPYTGDTLAEIPEASREDLEEAFAAARKAQPGWAEKLPAERAAVLRALAEVMQGRREEITDWLIRESGSTRLKAGMEWEAVYGVVLASVGMAYDLEGLILPTDIPGKEGRVYRKPVGVVGVISPWNWPLQLTARSLAPALALGNAVVVKPASDTPVTGGLLFAKLLEEAGLPPGVLSVLVGSGSEIGDAFVSHAVPRVISFTGSTAVGRQIARLAADARVMKRLELELGGNGVFVVLEDADLERAVEAAVFGKFLHQGQICMSINRMIVDARVYDEFVDRFGARVRSLRTGDPNAPDTLIGPIINQEQLDGLWKKVQEARRAGLREVAGGEPKGLVLPPHAFADVPNDGPLAQEEIFGPIAPVIRAADEEDAFRMADATEYGLSSSVFTRDVERGVGFAKRLEVGMVHVNDQPVNDLPNNPFGGERNSGIGRFNGRWAVDAFTTDQWITVQHRPREFSF